MPRFAVGTLRFVFHGGGIIYRIMIKSNIVKFLKLDIKKEKNVITDKDIELYIEIIKEIQRLSVANNVSLVIAYIDTANELLSNTKQTNDSLSTKFRKTTDNVIDVKLSEKREDLDQKYYIHELDQHPTSIANEHRAELISNFC